jgi:hypothetical protein
MVKSKVLEVENKKDVHVFACGGVFMSSVVLEIIFFECRQCLKKVTSAFEYGRKHFWR